MSSPIDILLPVDNQFLDLERVKFPVYQLISHYITTQSLLLLLSLLAELTLLVTPMGGSCTLGIPLRRLEAVEETGYTPCTTLALYALCPRGRVV